MNRSQSIQIKNRTNNSQTEILLGDMVVSHVLIGIAKHPQCQDRIRREYEEEKHREPQKKEYRYSHLFRYYPAIEAYHMRKISQLYMLQPDEKKDNFLMSYIKQGFNRVIQYVERNPFLLIEDFHDYYKKREVDYVSESEMQHLIALVVFVAWRLDKPINQDSRMLRISVENMGMNSMTEFDTAIEELPLDDGGRMKAMRQYEEMFNKKIKRKQALDYVVHTMEDRAFSLLSRESKKKFMTEEVYKQDFYRHFKSISALMRSNGFNDFNYLDNVQLDSDEYFSIYSIFNYMEEKGRLREDEWSMFFSTGLVLNVLGYHYKKLRKAYFEQEEELDKNRALALSVKEESHILENNRTAFEKEKGALLSQIDELKKQVEDSERKEKKHNQILHAMQDTIEELKKDNHDLKNLLFQEEEVAEETAVNIEELNEKMNEMKIAVIGGHPRFQAKLKGMYPGMRLIEPEEKNVDLSFLSTMDVVVFVTSYNNHVQYERMKQVLEGSIIPIFYLRSQPSPVLFATTLFNNEQIRNR